MIYMNNANKTKEQKIEELKLLSDYRVKLLAEKIDLKKTSKKEIEEMKATYNRLNKAIKQLSDELFGKIMYV